MRWVAAFSLALPVGLVTRNALAEDANERVMEVEVRAPPLAPTTAAKDPSVAGSTIRRSELQAPGLSAADALRTQVGVSLAETGAMGAPATASVRGATAAETPVYVAGVRINDDVAGAADLSTVPLWLMDRVEVYRGNAPLEADRLTLGGAIFFEPLRPNRTRAGLGALGGSYGSRGMYAYSGSGGPAHGLLLGVRLEGADNDYTFEDDNGTQFDGSDDRTSRLENADVSMLDVWLLGSSEIGNGRVDLTANHFEREQGANSLAVLRPQAARQSFSRTLASITGRSRLGESAGLELRTAVLFGRSLTDDPELELQLGTERMDVRGERVEQGLAGRFELGPFVTLRAGVDASSERLRRYEGRTGTEVSPVVDALRLVGRVFAGAEFEPLDGFELRPLAALECHSTALGNADACDALEPSARLGLLATFGEFSVFGGAGRYARVPTLGELYGISLAVHGNPELRSETGFTLDAGARFSHALEAQTRPLFVTVSGYFRRADELITFDRTPQSYIVPKNLDAARILGLELEAGSGFGRYFDGELGVTAFDGRDRSPDNPYQNDILPYHSRLIASGRLGATTPILSARGVVHRAAIGAKFLYQSSRYTSPSGLGVIPAQNSLDLDFTLSTFGGVALIKARVADVFDTQRFDVVGFPLPGRTFFASLELRMPEADLPH